MSKLYICPKCGRISTMSIKTGFVRTGDNGAGETREISVMDCCGFSPVFEPDEVFE